MVALFTKKEVQKAGNLIATVVWGQSWLLAS